MSTETSDAGHRQPLKNRLKKALATAALASALASAAWLGAANQLEAAGETRSLQMFHIHTKESINVTYMQNGRYVPSAMKKINYFMRDWRKNKTVTIDPKTIDLMWELHSDLGSKAPIHIVCGLRTAGTNAFLKRKGRNVAKKSQHTKGKAIDFYFPDVNTVKIRNSSLVRRVGGTGYYRSSAGPTGFLHIDTGNVRYWGPGISKSQWASIHRDAKKTIGRRLTRSDSYATASVGGEQKKGGFLSSLFGGRKKEPKIISEPEVVQEEAVPEAPSYEGYNEELAELAEESAVSAKPRKAAPAPVLEEPVAETPVPEVPVAEAVVETVKAKKKPAPAAQEVANAQLAALSQTAATEEAAEDEEIKASIKKGPPIPRPRMKPAEIMALAKLDNENVVIEPASADPESGIKSQRQIARDNKLLARKAAEAMAEQAKAETAAQEKADAEIEQAALGNDASNEGVSDGKSDFASEIANGKTEDAPIIRTAMANATEETSVATPASKLIRMNGAPQPLETVSASVFPEAAKMDAETPMNGDLSTNTDGKSDLMLVERDGKGNMQEVPENVTGEPLKLGSLEE
jgi:uncharacterized protein YcbK (DUF882 family)